MPESDEFLDAIQHEGTMFYTGLMLHHLNEADRAKLDQIINDAYATWQATNEADANWQPWPIAFRDFSQRLCEDSTAFPSDYSPTAWRVSQIPGDPNRS